MLVRVREKKKAVYGHFPTPRAFFPFLFRLIPPLGYRRVVHAGRYDNAADGVQEERDTWYGVRDVLSGLVVPGRLCVWFVYCGLCFMVCDLVLWYCGPVLVI